MAATIAVGSGVANGAYDVSLTAASGSSARKDVRVLGLNVEPNADLPNTDRIDSSRSVVSVAGPQVSPSFWACPTSPATLWVAYLDGNSHNSSAAKVYAARSTDGGVTWIKWQLDANDGEHYFPPAIAGSADCSSVTVAWVRETTTSATPTYSYWLYSRTYSAGEWGTIGTRDSLIGSSSYYMADPAVIYDRDSGDTPDVLLAWLHYTGSSSTIGIYSSVSTDNGSTWSSAADLVTGAVHRYPALTLDTANNHVWMAFRYSGTTSDIYVKYWNGNTNSWNATSTAVANTGNRENHPAISHVNGKLWVAWNRYTDYSNPTPELYYTYSTSTLPSITWATALGPYGTRLAEHTPPSITGDSSYSYIAYLAYTDAFRGANIYALKVNATTGALDTTYQLTSTADDPPLNARGNGGSPGLQWATTNLNSRGDLTGPTLLYSMNVPWGNALHSSYLANVGVAQTLYNEEEEDFDLWLAQVGTGVPTSVQLERFWAFVRDGQVVVEWETAAERNTAGFFVYRQDPGSAQRVKVNEGIVPASLTTTAGGTYRLLDPGAQPDGTYVYTLQEIEAGGGSRQYGPFTVTADEGGTAASMFSREAGMVYERVVHPATLPVQPTEPEPNTGTEVPTALPGATQQEADSLPFRVYLPLIQGHGAVTPATRLAKLTVRASSLYYLAAEDIASALGLSVNRAADLIALTRLKLSNQGQGVAYLPASGNAGLYFYAEGLDSLYTWDNVYWLEQAEGLSFGTQSAPVPAAVDVATFATTVHAEQNVQPVLGLLNDPAADYWMWDFVVAADPQSGSQSFGLHTDGAVPKGQASITAHFLGVTELGTGADHHARILLNGTTIGQAAWTGAVPYEVSPAFDSALLRDGTNTIEVVGMLDTGVPYSIFCVDSFEVSYQRQYRAVNDSLAFPSLDDQAITVYGFTDKNIMVFDLSNSYRPVQVNKTAVEAWEGAYRVTLKPAAAGVPYLALTTTAVPGVTTLAPDSPSALKGPNGAESLIITTAGLMEPAGALAAYRQGQGLQSQVVDVQDIYDEFNGGVASPEAVQAFLAYAYAHWSPDLRYVLLAGTGSYDYKNVLGYSDCLVPPILVGSVDHLAAADGRYEDVLGNDGTPELAVGRLPVVTAAEFEAYVTKIQAYEAADPTDWSKQVLMLANNADPSAGDFPADSDSLAALLPAEYTAQEVYLGPLSRAEARSQTLTALDSGVGAFHYVGHAGLSTLAAEGLLTSADVPGLQNSPRLPFMSAATCAVGDYAQPGYRSLGVLLALQGNGGMGAVFPPTGWSLNANGVALDTLLFQQLFEGNALRAGDASRAALAQYAAGGGPRYILDTYNLLGHPTMEMRWR